MGRDVVAVIGPPNHMSLNRAGIRSEVGALVPANVPVTGGERKLWTGYSSFRSRSSLRGKWGNPPFVDIKEELSKQQLVQWKAKETERKEDSTDKEIPERGRRDKKSDNQMLVVAYTAMIFLELSRGK